MLFIYAAIFGTIFFGISNIIIKFAVSKINGSLPFLVLQMNFAFAVLLPIFLIEQNWIDKGYMAAIEEQFLNIFLSAIFGLTGFIFMIIGLEKGTASVGTVIFSSRVIFAIPLAIVFVNEIYSIYIYFLILIAFVGAVTVSYRKSLSFEEIIKFQAPGVRYFFLTPFFWALSDFYVRRAENTVPVVDFLFIRQIFFTIGAILTYYIGTRHFSIAKIKRSKYGILGTLGFVLTNLLAQGLFIYALGESLTITSAIGTAQGVFTLIISLIISFTLGNETLNEPLDNFSISVRMIGALIATVATAGVALLT